MHSWSVARLSCAFVLVAAVAQAQWLPSGPLAFGDGRVTIAGDFSAAAGSADPGFYNYTDYQYSALRRVRAGVTGGVTANDHFAVLGELRVEHATPQLFALYARIRPWASRSFDVQVGRLPPTFGAFARRVYGADNPLIGTPIAYQYLTSLRPDSLPANADELLRMRGRGWRSVFSVGAHTFGPGVPVVEAFRWDTGVQVHAETPVLEATASVTTGTLANPLVRDDNGAPQFAGRLAVHPAIGLTIGSSFARGRFITTDAAGAAGTTPSGYVQGAWGLDAEYSRDHYQLRGELILNRWTLPEVGAPYIDESLGARTAFVEGRYTILPGLYAAARADYLGFSTIAGSTTVRTWDAPVTRFEVGGGYYLQRNLILKASFQRNERDTFFIPSARLGAIEVVFWF
jgi:hypothetical protein